MIAVRARVTGRVQGVGFRWHTRAEAGRLRVAGWVKNLPDGSVEAHLEGAARDVDRMVAWLSDGPSAASVDDLVVTPADVEGCTGFEIHR